MTARLLHGDCLDVSLSPTGLYYLANKAVSAVSPYGPVGHLDREDLIQEAVLGMLENFAKLEDGARANPGSFLLMAGRWKAGELVRYHRCASRWQGTRPKSLDFRAPAGSSFGELLPGDRRPDVIDSWPTGGEIRAERRRIAEEMVAAGATTLQVQEATGLTFSGAWHLCGKIRNATVPQQTR